MTDSVSGKPLAQELEQTRKAQLQAIKKARQELKNDDIDDKEQADELKALKNSAKSLKLYPALKANGQYETTQEVEAKYRTSLEAEKTNIEQSLVQFSEKQDTLADQKSLLESLKNNGLESVQRESLKAAGFNDEEMANLLTRGQRIAEQEKIQALKKISNHPDPLNEKEIEDLKKAGFSDEEIQELHDPDTRNLKIEKAGKKLSALKTITEAEDEKLKEAGLKAEELTTDDQIQAKLDDTKKQQETLKKVQETLEDRNREVKRLQALGNTPEAEGTQGSQGDSNPESEPQADGGCPNGNCGRQRGRGRAKATIMAVAATELAALQIDYSQFLS